MGYTHVTGENNMATNTEVKRAANKRKRSEGLIPKYVWIHRLDEPKFNKDVKRMNNKRGIK